MSGLGKAIAMGKRCLAGFLGGAIALASCGGLSARQMQRDTADLTGVFEILEKLRVEAYRNQDWCQNMVYERGRFSDNPDRSTCNLFSGEPQGFEAQASADFQEVEQAIADTQVNVIYITNLAYDRNGDLAQAQFHLDTSFNRYSYVYDPDYSVLPEDVENERIHTRLSENWYAVWEDWN